MSTAAWSVIKSNIMKQFTLQGPAFSKSHSEVVARPFQRL